MDEVERKLGECMARCEQAEGKLRAIARELKAQLEVTGELSARLGMVSTGVSEVWLWQMGGENNSFSLACPVVMSAATLRDFLGRESQLRMMIVSLVVNLEAMMSMDASTIKGDGRTRLYAQAKLVANDAHALLVETSTRDTSREEELVAALKMQVKLCDCQGTGFVEVTDDDGMSKLQPPVPCVHPPCVESRRLIGAYTSQSIDREPTAVLRERESVVIYLREQGREVPAGLARDVVEGFANQIACKAHLVGRP